MNTVIGLLKNRAFYAVVFSVVMSLAFVSYIATAATTISTNISTGGTLSVTGVSTLTGNVYASSTANALVVTGQARFYDQVVLDSAASDPTGDAAGAMYWDTANKLIRVYDGTDWRTVASSTSGSGGLIVGATNGIRFNTIATGYMALGTSTLPIATINAGNALLFLNSTTTATVPLLISGVGGGDLSDMIRVVNGVYTEVFAVDAVGNASTTGLSIGRANGFLMVGGYATTTGSNGNIATEGTLAVISTSAFTGNSTFAGNVTLGNAAADSIIITGNATTSNALTVRGLSFDVAGYATTTVSILDSAATTTLGNVFGSALGIGTTTPMIGAKLGVAGDITAGSSGTTTLRLDSSGAGTCIQMRTTNGVLIRLYATTTPVAGSSYFGLAIEAGVCKTP